MKDSYDLLVRGGTVVPMVRDREWFRGDVLVRDGRIAAVTRGPAADIEAERVVDAGHGLVLPGFVQGHVHVVQSLLRHRADGLELLDWLKKRTWPYEASLDGDDVEAAAELGIAELLCGGTTTALDFGTTHDHGRVFEAAERLGIRLLSGKTHMDLGDGCPAALVEDLDSSLAQAEELGTRWHGAAGGRLRYAVAPRFALSCTRPMLEGCAALARDNGWLLQSHASENAGEVEEVRHLTGLGNIEYLHSAGLTGEDVVLAHGVHLGAEERSLLAGTGTRICHCPGANLKLASGIADLPALLAAGVPVALGADGPPCNNRLSVFHEMALAGTLHNLRHGPRAIDPWTVLAMATREGARALGLGKEVGVLEVGYCADLTVLDASAWAMQPDGDPAARIVFGATAGDVRHAVVGGRPVVENRELLTADAAAITDKVQKATRAVEARMEECLA
jgi:cytosine/adenosine deaminase-related metal-dependent hydrolase